LASTFTGLCADHDKELFKLADDEALDTSDKEQLKQYAHRALMKEFHTCVEQSDRFFALELDYIKKGFIKPDTPNGAAEAAIVYAKKSHDLFKYRNKYFDALKGGEKTSEVEHTVIELDNQAPTIAVSSFLSLGHEADGSVIGAMLTVVPVSETRTVAIITCAAAHKDAVKRALPDLFDADTDKKKALSDTILTQVENFTLSLTFYDRWTEEKKKDVAQAFNESKVPEDQELSLF
jgi:ferredoxin